MGRMTSAVLAGFVVVGLMIFLPVVADSEAAPREIVLVTRDMAFYLEGQQIPNPVVTMTAGETVRIVVRNKDAGIGHNFEVPVEKVAGQTTSLIKTIEAAVASGNLPTKTSTLCDWCEFRPQCPEFANLYELESENETLPFSTITASEASALVDEFASLRHEKRRIMGELDERIEEIREKLASYSTETGNTSIYGNEYYATVFSTTLIDIPKADSGPRAKLEVALKALGLWEQVGQLSSNKLKKLVDSGACTDAQLEAINKYLERSEYARVELRKRK